MMTIRCGECHVWSPVVSSADHAAQIVHAHYVEKHAKCNALVFVNSGEFSCEQAAHSIGQHSRHIPDAVFPINIYWGKP